MNPESLSAVLRESARIKIQSVEGQTGALFKVIDAVVSALTRRNTVFFFANGGSIADSQHLAGDWEACTRIILASGTTLEPC